MHRFRSDKNVADFGTKPLSKAVIAKHFFTLGYVIMDAGNVWGERQQWRCSGTSVQQSARSGMQQVTMSRHQPPEICSNGSSCRIRSSRSKRREIARDAKEDVALHYLSFDTSPKLTSESSDRENTYEFPRGNVITVGTKRLRCTEPTTNLHRAP